MLPGGDEMSVHDPIGASGRMDLASRFKARYVGALVALGVMVTAMFISAMALTDAETRSLASINVAGRQRMLSQKIALLSLELLHAEYDSERVRVSLNSAITLMEESHAGLVEGSGAMGLRAPSAESALGRLYKEPPHQLDARTRRFLEQARSWAAAPPEERVSGDGRLEYILREANGELLVLLDRAVTLFQVDSEQAFGGVRVAFVALFVMTLAGLLVVALLVFHPMARLIKEETDRLVSIQREQRLKADEQEWSSRLQDALDMVDGELELLTVVERAMGLTSDGRSMELLLADASDAHVHQAAVHPAHGGPGCGVESPWGCTAVRRGHEMLFESSRALNACPRLVERAGDACSAMCVPVAFMGRSLGVLHVAGAEHEPPSPEERSRLTLMASLIGSRIGTVRTFERVQLQAATDPLTGLINRRTLQERLRELKQESARFALAMVDLDHFKRLNDTYGHDVGDQALSVFTKVATEALGERGFAARFGGEEFVVVMPGLGVEEGEGLLNRIRERLALTLRGEKTPAFTASFGLADTTMSRDASSLLRCADQALLRAKSEGRDRVVIASIEDGVGVSEAPVVRLEETGGVRRAG